ncbi:PqqD family protein [Merismopedia glauca]|uniref:PqqD family protein n=1 Tax=Merismopedia glauca CCAP 1448/3 TaxID=1296344 RepID=A0A2T1C4V7_9CYAN|nr:PqqD family protein [Merismopedia glauca]PSB03315.1 PqqD family protein [Merismopedia glauca CCAP 1448/3]
MKFDPTQKLVVSPDVLVQDLGEESVLLNLKSEKYFGLDDVGTRMWEALTQSESIAAAYKLLLAEYDVEEELLTQDLAELVDKLSSKGLVEVVETSN